MWKKSLVALFVASSATFAFATEATVAPSTQVQQTWNSEEIEKLKQEWLIEQSTAQKNLLTQRENFLQLESLMQAARRDGRVSPAVLEIADKLYATLTDYPLKEEAAWAILRTRIHAKQALVEDLTTFAVQSPSLAKRNNVTQLPYEMLFQQQKFAELIEYSKANPPTAAENQCRLFAAQYQLLAEKIQPNPEAEQAGTAKVSISAEMSTLLNQFDQFWVNTDVLPAECASIEAYWKDQGFKGTEKVKDKVVTLFGKNAKKEIENLIANNSDIALGEWLKGVQILLNEPNNLQNFIEKSPLVEGDKWSRSLIITTFPRFVRSLSEQMPNPSFSIYEEWATKLKLTPKELREWKISFISRQFDNQDPVVQLWRDEQLKELKVDNLTERRLRMAIWQKADLREWLNILSDEGKAKQEWRYWLAKIDIQQRDKLLSDLVKERGFYPMLAANLLKKTYQLTIPEVKSLTEEQKQKFQKNLARIAELRELKRFGPAKATWIEMLQGSSFEESLALSEYALNQSWFDLGVEATIQAKAWDYLNLRVPNAYSEWFDINLANKPITKSFAMAIARQESAWNFQARSHADAMGLMQMLNSTASKTAEDNNLPYRNEQDLVEPFRNIMLGTTHLMELNQRYPNNRILIASAYNAGSSRADRWLTRANGRLEMDEFIASIPFLETRGYVQNVIAYDYYYQQLYGKGEKVMFYPEEQRIY
ncbi:lytic murein transglycosylase [Pasteurellaceae bacterium 15-036681]|nr:lytic murein transglycosylase [Pasteurellaceae bacterium 15-036681]